MYPWVRVQYPCGYGYGSVFRYPWEYPCHCLCTPEEDEPQDPFLQQEDDPKPSERDLVQALELLVNKIAGMPSASSKSKNQVKPCVPDTFDGSDPGKLETFIFQCSMYLAIRASDFSDDEARVAFALSYLKGSPQDWFQSEISHVASEGGRLPE